MSLTLKRVESLLARGDVGKYIDHNGLYLIVSGKGAGHWSHRYQYLHRQHWMGLGPVAAFNLLEARELNRKALQERATGIDPLTAKRARQQAAAAAANAAAKVTTFRAMAEKYITDNQGGWGSAQHGRQWIRSLQRYVYPLIGNRDVAAIDKSDVLTILEQQVAADRGSAAGKFWDTRLTTADRVRSRIELVLNAAVARDLRPPGINPASIDILRHALPKRDRLAPVAHHAAMAYAEVPQFMVTLGARQGIAPRALEFLILTAARAGEVIGATWDEIDSAAATWTIPAERMKAQREHKVPLSEAALALLKVLPREDGNPHVFIGLRRPMLSHGAMMAVLERMGRSDTTIHGFRSSFRTWAAERTNFPPEIPELALAHSVNTAIEKAYKRTTLFDHRARLMQQWATYCAAPTARSKGGEVVGIGIGGAR
jgi:integrase